ncbi:hypothetical protein H9P43_005205 [Blastocladiella emersonii ATCC 22665]|nr:hypothetical protein H9P43_005205 [Blastocladiella emersonii ATCC 22665]
MSTPSYLHVPSPSLRAHASCPTLGDEFRAAGVSPPNGRHTTTNTNTSPPASPSRSGAGRHSLYGTAAYWTSSSSKSGRTSPVDDGGSANLIRDILRQSSLYAVLGVDKAASFDEIRRAYLLRSRMCHPDKHPGNPRATEAFQKISSAYSTLKQSSTRAAYDLAGERVTASGTGDETLYQVLVQVWFEFIEGNYDTLLMVADMLAQQNHDISRESVERLLHSVRSLMHTGSQCLAEARPAFFDALDLQAQLAALPYLDLVGRLKLSLRLLHVLLSIPITVNRAAGGNALPQWAATLLHAMLAMLGTAEAATLRVTSAAGKLSPDVLRSVLLAAPLRAAGAQLKVGLGALVTGWGWSSWFSSSSGPASVAESEEDEGEEEAIPAPGVCVS